MLSNRFLRACFPGVVRCLSEMVSESVTATGNSGVIIAGCLAASSRAVVTTNNSIIATACASASGGVLVS